jgi:hypothetical protein
MGLNVWVFDFKKSLKPFITYKEYGESTEFTSKMGFQSFSGGAVAG